MIAGPQRLGERFDAAPASGGRDREKRAMGRDGPQPADVARVPAELVDSADRRTRATRSRNLVSAVRDNAASHAGWCGNPNMQDVVVRVDPPLPRSSDRRFAAADPAYEAALADCAPGEWAAVNGTAALGRGPHPPQPPESAGNGRLSDTTWKSDNGDPDTKDGFDINIKYSPLRNITPGTSYPATLVTAADHDDGAVPAHGFRFGATLRAAQAGPAPVLIGIETKVGHRAGKPTTKQIEERTDVLGFLVRGRR